MRRAMIRRYRPQVNLKAMWLSFIMLICSYVFSNFSASVTGEPDILQAIELFKDYFDLGSPETSFPDSIVLVNVSYDRELIPYNDGVNEGNIDITDRNKLIEFLTLARNTEYRYILLDIALDKRLLKDTPLNDSLYNTITTIPNLFISKSEDFVTDERLKQKGGWVDYCTNVFEETFTKISIVEDDTVSLAMRIYEDQQKKHIKSYFNVFFSFDGRLVRRCIYPKMYINNRNLTYLNLGSDLLNESVYTDKDLEILLKDKIIVVGAISGPLDVHNTYIGNLSGAVINTNIYLSLCNGAYNIPMWLILVQFMIFYACGIVIFRKSDIDTTNKKSPLVLLWAYYSVFLSVLVALIYILTGEAYDILFTATLLTLIHWTIKTKRYLWKSKK